MVKQQKVLLYGGAFNPPHLGHKAVAEAALEHMSKFGYEQLWFVPSAMDMFGKKTLVSPEHRFGMLVLMTSTDMGGRFSVEMSDIKLENNKGTYALLCHMRKIYPTYEFAFVIGSDQALKIKKWRNYERLLEKIPLVIVERWTGLLTKDIKSTVDDLFKNADYYFVPYQDVAQKLGDLAFKDISSTKIKKDLLNCQHLLSTVVSYYINLYNLYQRQNNVRIIRR